MEGRERCNTLTTHENYDCRKKKILGAYWNWSKPIVKIKNWKIFLNVSIVSLVK